MPLAKCPHARALAGGRAGRTRRSWRGAAGTSAALALASVSVLPATVLTATVLAATALTAPSAAWASPKGSTGSLVLKGFLSGTLKVPAFLPPGQLLTGCQIAPTQSGTVVLQWDSAKLNVNGQTKTLKNIDVQVTVTKFGHTYSMTPDTYGASEAAITFQSNMGFGWSSDSGALTTSKSGASGSVSGAMTAGKAHSGTVTIKGTWGGCAKLG
jgi:hypothetical protein